MQIAVVDDERPSFNTFIDSLVDESDIDCKWFQNNPLYLLEYIENNNIDIVFLDINMPIINGIDLAKKLMEKKSDIKIVFISGYEQDEKKIKEDFGNNLIGFYHKPYEVEDLNKLLSKYSGEIKKEIKIRCFGQFNIFINNKPVYFESKKSKEILAILIDSKGGFVSMDKIISLIWPNVNFDHGKTLYKDNVYRLRRTLKKYGINDIMEYGRAQLAINTKNIYCDYWNYLNNGDSIFLGDYMTEYDWNNITIANLINIRRKRQMQLQKK